MNIYPPSKGPRSFKSLLLAISSFFFFHYQLQATTIIPFPNLGEMGIASDAIVLAKAIENYEIELNGATRLRTRFEVTELIKGNVGNEFEIQSLNLQIGDLTRIIDGEPEFLPGDTYLIFLEQANADYWRPWMMAHAVFKQWDHNGERLLAPLADGLNFQVLAHPSGIEIEPLKVYPARALLQELTDVTQGVSDWNGEAISSNIPLDTFIALEERGGGTLPSHCTFLSGTPYARWQNMPGTPLPVRYHTGGDSGCASWLADTQSALNDINTGYIGVNLSDAGTHTFVPTCSGQGANDSEFTSFVGSNYGLRNMTIQFDDPCSEITDLSGCSGTLAIGGLYWSSSTYVDCGETWRIAAYGYVVFNNGTGACNCGANYSIIMTHELTHSLNIGHIAASNGAANMNPSCCNSIQTLDQDCLGYIYPPPAPLPVELTEFDAKKELESVLITWQTAAEYQNEFFELEHSKDGKIFETLKMIAGAGTSHDVQFYEFEDNNPFRGTNYYRLKQSDFNGTTTYSEIKSIHFGKEEIISEIYPNPVETASLQLSLDTETEALVTVEIINIDGRKLLELNVDIEKGKNKIELGIADFQAGLYFLKINKGNGYSETKRFVKQ